MVKRQKIENVLIVHEPETDIAPVVLDSPHSGNIYPTDFGTIVARADLRRTEDAFVEQLYAEGPAKGAILIEALFPRCYIDANRNAMDLDQNMIAGTWPGELKPGKKTVVMGSGLIWRTGYPDLEMYDRKLSIAEVRNRIDTFHAPYHNALTDALSVSHRRFGRVYHINCHSMPSMSSGKSPEGPGKERPEFVLGDANGTSCSAAFTRRVHDVLAKMGYHVTINDPYNGAELIRAYSNPAAGRHSLQIEIKRQLYMDEQAITKNAGFDKLKTNLSLLLDEVVAFARAN